MPPHARPRCPAAPAGNRPLCRAPRPPRRRAPPAPPCRARRDPQVCATIHSPTPYCFNLFDRLLLLLRGRVVYFGPNGRLALDYFHHQARPGALRCAAAGLRPASRPDAPHRSAPAAPRRRGRPSPAHTRAAPPRPALPEHAVPQPGGPQGGRERGRVARRPDHPGARSCWTQLAAPARLLSGCEGLGCEGRAASHGPHTPWPPPAFAVLGAVGGPPGPGGRLCRHPRLASNSSPAPVPASLRLPAGGPPGPGRRLCRHLRAQRVQGGGRSRDRGAAGAGVRPGCVLLLALRQFQRGRVWGWQAGNRGAAGAGVRPWQRGVRVCVCARAPTW